LPNFQIVIIPSLLAETKVLLSLLRIILVTEVLCDFRFMLHLEPSKFHIFIFLCLPAENKRLPSSVVATLFMLSLVHTIN
jgi:hypothetical protein